jgi:hypothetical protein
MSFMISRSLSSGSPYIQWMFGKDVKCIYTSPTNNRHPLYCVIIMTLRCFRYGLHLPLQITNKDCIMKTPCNIRGPFTKFVDPPYYTDSELCGGAVTVPFSKYLSLYFVNPK